MRHPALMLPLLRRQVSNPDVRSSRAALLGEFFVLERWGRSLELQPALERARDLAERQRAHADAAELSEALGRLHYQRGDYNQACKAWSQTLGWAADDSRSACQARIGLAHLCYALGEWARGGRVLEEAQAHYARLPGDAYLRAKIALNRAASLRATQGPQAALPALDEALSAAREAGHRDYQAEAIWHHARCARDRGDPVLAGRLARQAQQLARACGYRWLEGQACLLLSELEQGPQAQSLAQEALDLAEGLQARALQAAAHARLAELAQARGELGPGWHHAQQAQRLEASLAQNQMPAGLEALARFDTDPTGADGLLLELAGQAWALEKPADLERAWAGMLPRLREGLELSALTLWWDESGRGHYRHLAGSSALEAAPLTAYLQALSAPGTPLQQTDSLAHPWRAELDQALGAADWPRQSRLELGLRVQTRLVGVLWLQRPLGAEWSRADVARAQRLAALLERLLAQLPGQASAAPAARQSLVEAAQRLRQLLAAPSLDRVALEALARDLERSAQA